VKALTKTLVIMLVLALLPAVVSAGTAPAVVSVDSYTVTVGQEFTVPVRIANVSNLYGADVRVAFDPAVLQGVSVVGGGFLNYPNWVIRQGFYGPGPWCPSQCAWYALTQLRPALPVSGSGVLAYVTFRALQPGTSPLTVLAQLGAAGGIPIPATTQSGTVTVVAVDKER